MHFHFVRKFVPFLQVAADAGGDDIRPFRDPSPRPGNEMIAGEMLGVEFLPAILTGVVVAKKDVPSGELHFGVVAAHKGEEANDGGLTDCYRDAPDLPVVLFENLHFSQINKRDGLLP
jgi:hypothetical protein